MTSTRSAPAQGRLNRVPTPVKPGLHCKSELSCILARICKRFDSLRGKTSPPYKYKGPRPIEGIQSIKYNFYLLLFFPLPYTFPIYYLLFLLRLYVD